jgi:outer membrane protein
MKTQIRILKLALAATTLASAAAVQAQTSNPPAQPHSVKLGFARYETHSVTNGVTGIGIPPGADAKTGNANTALMTYEYLVQPYLGIELVLGVPPKIKAQASGSVAFLGEVLSARSVSPTLLMTYHFGQAGDTVRPYVGMGLSYTRFSDVKSPYGWQVSLSESLGFAGHAGLDVALAKNWGVYASAAVSEVKTDLQAVGATVIKSRISFRPRIYSAGVFYRF